MKAGIALPFADGPGRGWLPDGSRMTWLNAPSGRKADRLPVRAAEHNAVFPAGEAEEEAPETCTIITTLLDHEEAPACQVRETYLTRWSVAETTFGQDKATITGAGNRTSGPVLRSGCPQLVLQEARAWLADTQLVRASAVATLRSEHAAARAQRRKNARPATADEESFTAAWRHAARSMQTSQVTATSSLEAIAAAGESAARAAATAGLTPGEITFTAVLSLARAAITAGTCCPHCHKRPASGNALLAGLGAAITALPPGRAGRQRTSGRTPAERRKWISEPADYTLTIVPSNLPKQT